jgi:hypothetical protein
MPDFSLRGLLLAAWLSIHYGYREVFRPEARHFLHYPLRYGHGAVLYVVLHSAFRCFELREIGKARGNALPRMQQEQCAGRNYHLLLNTFQPLCHPGGTHRGKTTLFFPKMALLPSSAPEGPIGAALVG